MDFIGFMRAMSDSAVKLVMAAEEWLDYYERVRPQVERWGDGSTIPVGATVRTHRAGFGGGPRIHRTFGGTDEGDTRYFKLTDARGWVYLSRKETWFLDFEVLGG